MNQDNNVQTMDNLYCIFNRRGVNPTYQWLLGTNIIGTNNNTFTLIPTMADNGKIITVKLTSSDACNTGVAVSNQVQLNLVESKIPSVTIKPFISGTCIGDLWAFDISNNIDHGNTPTPNWYLNGILMNKHDYTASVHPQNGDEIYAIMTFSYECVIGSATVQSNTIIMEGIDCGTFSLPISGPYMIPQSGQSNVVYSVPNQSGSTYDWDILGGTIVSGQHTNSIIVDWGEIKYDPWNLQTRAQYYIILNETNEANFTHTTQFDINPIITTSISKSLSQSGITLFPNPTTESFNIEMPESGIAVRYEILDLTGASVAQGNFVSSNASEKIATNFGAGMYQVVMHYNNIITIGRLSKVQ